ncbi:proconvertase P-domain protein, partial [Vibrio parahaemolyticus V-223/04]
MDTESYRYKR